MVIFLLVGVVIGRLLVVVFPLGYVCSGIRVVRTRPGACVSVPRAYDTCRGPGCMPLSLSVNWLASLLFVFAVPSSASSL